MPDVNSNLIELPNKIEDMNFGERIRNERKDKKWSQEELARRAGVTQGLISQMEKGINKGSAFLNAIARALEVESDWLENGKGQKKRREVNAPMSLHYPPMIEDTIAAIADPDREGIVLVVFRDSNGSQVTLRLLDTAASTLAEKLAALGK